MSISMTMGRASRGARIALGAAALAIALSAQAAPGALRAYATEWNREAQPMSVAQKERLIGALLDRWEPAALRAGADARTWRDTFGLQLSMLPGSTLAELAAAAPENGFHGIVARVSETLRSAAEKRTVRTKALGETTTDLVFVPINPCRIVDTRFGGGGVLSSGSPRDFIYANPPGGSFAAQGGAGSNCGLVFAGGITPLPPRAIAATVTVVPSGAGNLVIYPTGSVPGTTSALNYTAGAVLANTTVVVGAQGGAADFTVALNGPPHMADVIVDAVGYYYAPAATPLDCTTVATPPGGSATGDLAAGASAIFTATCTAGYQISGGGCTYFTTAQQSPQPSDNKVILNRSLRPFDAGTQTFTNQWSCHWTNTDTVVWRVQVRAVCCRTPGR